MRYKSKEKFNRIIMKNLNKMQKKGELKIINYNLPSIPNENNNENKYKNNLLKENFNENNNNNNPNAYITNSTLRKNILGRKKSLASKESFLKKALDNMAKNYLNKSEDSQIFNMEKNDQITENINLEKEKLNKISKNFLKRKDSVKYSSHNKNINKKNQNKIYIDNKDKENSTNSKNKKSKNKFGISGKLKNSNNKLKIGENKNYFKKDDSRLDLVNDLQGPTIDFYQKRMDYLSNMYLNVKNSPFEYLESEENSTKKKFNKYIPKSATIFKERQENFSVHLIKKFSDFKNPHYNGIRSKTANMKNNFSKFFT